MPYIHNFKEQILLTANCFNKINFQTISSITIDFYIVSFLYLNRLMTSSLVFKVNNFSITSSSHNAWAT